MAFDVSPDRAFASVAVAGLRADGKIHGEVADHGRGVPLGAGTGRGDRRPQPFGEGVVRPDGSAASLVEELDRLGVQAEAVSARDLANACGRLFDLVDDEEFIHLGQPELNAAVRGAAQRSLGEAWAWSRQVVVGEHHAAGRGRRWRCGARTRRCASRCTRRASWWLCDRGAARRCVAGRDLPGRVRVLVGVAAGRVRRGGLGVDRGAGPVGARAVTSEFVA